MVNSKSETSDDVSTQSNEQSPEKPSEKSNSLLYSLESIPSREERVIHSSVRRFKTTMKSAWCNLHKLKTEPKIYAFCFIKFEKSYYMCSLSRNDVKFVFDRIIDHMCLHDWPSDIFHGRNCIGGTNFRNASYFCQFFSISGIKELYKMHHRLASHSEFYFRNRLYSGQQLSKQQKDLIIDFCALLPLMQN